VLTGRSLVANENGSRSMTMSNYRKRQNIGAQSKREDFSSRKV